MGVQIKRRDVGALVLLLWLELGLMCLLGATCSADGEPGAARVWSLTFHWPTLGPDPAPPAPVAEPTTAELPPEPVVERREAPRIHVSAPKLELPAVVAVPPAAAPAPMPKPSLADTVERDDTDAADPCGGDLCCVAVPDRPRDARETWRAQAASTGQLDDGTESDRLVVRWPASRRDDVVYRVFTLPGRRLLGVVGDNSFVHHRMPGDPDCYKIQACDRAGSAAGKPLTICVTHHRTWG